MNSHEPSAGDAAAAARIHYRERQPVRWTDLITEQAYLLALRRRHDRGHHRWGIVAGLALATGADGVLVQPGMAIDGYGRSLTATAPIKISYGLLAQIHGQTGAGALDVWLLYGVAPCHGNRPLKAPVVRLRAVDDAAASPTARQPGEVPAQDLNAGPEKYSPDDPVGEWPVYLGRLTPDSASAWDVHLDDRPYAGLIGESIVSPSGDARMLIGTGRPGDSPRFAIAVGAAHGPLTDRLAVDRTGTVAVQGDVRLDGILTLAATGNPAPAAGLGLLPAVPTAAMPWRLYRTLTGEGPVKTDELRLEIGHPGDKGDPARYRLAIGYVGDGQFQRCLSARADRAVTVAAGKLVIDKGKLVVNAPAAANPADPRFAAAITAPWLDSVARTGVKLDALYAGALSVAIGGTAPIGEGKTLSYTVTVRNPGPVLVRQVAAADEANIENTTVGGGQLPALPALNSGGAQTWQRQVQIPANRAGKKLRITLTATGTGPSGYPVHATPVSVDVDITS